MEPVNSSVIKSVGYNARAQILRVEFHTFEIYEYENVPWWAAARLLSAGSIGRFYNLYIRDNYPFRKINRADAA